MSISSGRKKKAEIRNFLMDRDFNAVLKWAETDQTPFKTLTSLLFDSDPLICWRTIDAFGRVAAVVADRDIKSIRRQLQRFLWLMNDESGGICWYAPEAIGEVIYNVPQLTNEYGLILTSFLNEEPFEGGVRWTIARLISRGNLPQELTDAFQLLIPRIAKSLGSDNPKIRGNALLAMEALGADAIISDNFESLKNDTGVIQVYEFESGTLNNMEIGTLAAGLLKDK